MMKILVVEPTDARRSDLVDTLATLPGVELRAATASLLVGRSVLSSEVIDAVVVGGVPVVELASLAAIAAGQACPVVVANNATELRAAVRRLQADEAGLRLERATEQLELHIALPALITRIRKVVPDHIELSLLIADGTPPVLCLPAVLEHVVLDLVLLACASLPWGGTVWVTAERTGERQVKLDVLENGKGKTLDLTLRAAPPVAS